MEFSTAWIVSLPHALCDCSGPFVRTVWLRILGLVRAACCLVACVLVRAVWMH